jgi:hypothetical protein
MGRVYATVAQYTDYTQQAAPAGTDRLLVRASSFLESQIFRLAVYTADLVTGLPTNPLVAKAMADAVCAQVEWWQETGDPLGVAGQWQQVRIGSLHLMGPSNSGAQSTGRQIAPAVKDALDSSDLVDVFRMGAMWSGVGW